MSDGRSSCGPLRAVVWDFDGTLVDTRRRNLAVNRRIVEDITGRDWRRIPVLSSFQSYDGALRESTNWREFYLEDCGLTMEEMERAATMWTTLQRSDSTPLPLFEGLSETFRKLSHLPHGIVSQNDREIIGRVVEENGLAGMFGSVVGYAEVEMARQKPAPDGLLRCIEELTSFEDGSVLYVGDHETDARCAAAANRELVEHRLPVRVWAVAAFFVDGDHDLSGWTVQPDLRANEPADVFRLAAGFDGGQAERKDR